MRILFLGFAVSAAILASSMAQAKSALIPSFQGKIYNHTSIPSDQLEIRVTLDCTYTSGFVWPESKSCGYESLKISVAKDGSFVIPDMKWQKGASISKYSFYLAVDSKGKEAWTGYHTSITHGILDGKDIKKTQAIFKEISIYEMPETRINVVTPTGQDYASWRGTIQNSVDQNKPCVELIYLMNLPATYNFNQYTEIKEHNTDAKVAGVVPRYFFGTTGNPGKSLQVEGSLYYSSSKPECTTYMKKVNFENAVKFTGTVDQVHNHFNNSTYKVD